MLELFETVPEPLEMDELEEAQGTYEESKMNEGIEMVSMDFKQSKVTLDN